MSTSSIEINQISKRFGAFSALDNVSLVVEPGCIHGFLGPNGAGKSTTIRCLLGLIRPDTGSVKLAGIDATRNPALANSRCAYVPGDTQLWPHLTGGQVLETLAKLRAAHRKNQQSGDNLNRRNALIERFALDPTKKVRTYSKGNRQKVILIAALAAEVDVIVFDEPTSGLDPLMEQEFIAAVKQRQQEGAAILLSSHILSEVQDLASDISIIRKGKIVESGPLEALSHVRGARVHAVLPDGTEYDHVHASEEINSTLQQLLTQQAKNITCTPASLEDLFLEFYETGK